MTDMDTEKGKLENENGAEAKCGDAENVAVETEAGTSREACSDVKEEVESDNNKDLERSDEKDGEMGGHGTGSKEDDLHTERGTTNAEQKIPLKNEPQPNQSGGDSVKNNDNNGTSPKINKENNSEENETNGGTDAITEESSILKSSSSQEPKMNNTEENDSIAKDREHEATKENEDSGKNQLSQDKDSEHGTQTEETGESESKEAKTINKDVQPEEQKAHSAGNSAGEQLESSEQKSKNLMESEEEKREDADTEGLKLHTDDSKEKSMPDENDEDNIKMDIETNSQLKKSVPNNDGKSPTGEDNTSLKKPMDSVQSSNITIVDVDRIVTKPFKPDPAFDEFRRKRSSKKKKAKKQESIKINISGISTEIKEAVCSDVSKMANIDSENIPPDTSDALLSCQDFLVPHKYHVVEKEHENSLEFFEEPHEDQDPMYAELLNKEKRELITLGLKNLRVEEESGKKEIAAIVNQQLQEKKGSTERYFEKQRLKTVTEQKNDLARMQQNYTVKARSNKGKIDRGIAVLKKNHNEENQKYLQQHRQQVQARRVPEQVASQEWQQIAQRLHAKHTRQMQDFSRKGREVMNKSKLDYEREQTKVKQAYEKRLKEMNAQRQNFYTRIIQNLQQIKQRHLKRHVQSIKERREALEQELASTQSQQTTTTLGNDNTNKKPSQDNVKSETEERVDRMPVSPIKSATHWREESTHEPSGAAARHKHRKGVLSTINRQLSVEIHNEGIWISEILEKKSNQNKAKDSSDNADENDKKYFFPWGVKARKILESIVCGEIPQICDSLKLNFNETAAQNGGHVRCVMTDLRTSDATASAQRAEAIIKKEVDDVKKIEEKETAIKKNMVDMEKNMEIIKKQQHDLGLKLKETLKDYEKTKQHLQAFRTKYGSFFGPDGKPLPTNDPGDTRKLTQHGLKYKMAIESSEKRGIAIKTKISELHASLTKRQTNYKTGQRAIASLNATIKSKKNIINEVKTGRVNLLQTKSIENPSTRVKDTINILGVTADMRREQLNQKRNSNTSSQWVQSLPGIPAPLRRSLWYKMHRRRQQIVLRPTFSSMLTNMRKEIESKITSIDTGIRRGSKEAIGDKMIKAEQTYLLATHPVEKMNENLGSLPSSPAWAEPGWHLKLDMHEEEGPNDRILPCPPRQPLVQYNLSELYSAPGRQAASMINSTHLRSLETPLSAVATATSLSETDPAMAKSSDPILSSNDPLKMTRDALKSGYAFSICKTQAVRPTVTRRKSSSTKDTASSTSTKGTKRRQSTGTASGTPKSTGAQANSNATRAENTRKRKSTTQADSASTPRAVQRKRAEPLRQIPVDDQAFQPRPIMTQPQQQQQQHASQSAAPFLQQAMPQQQQNPYNNQFMNTLPSPVAQQQQAGHRGSFNQFQNTPQMNQFRMMQQQQSHHQQQHIQHANQPKVNYGQIQQQPMRPNPQFFPQLGQQQFPQQQIQMPGQAALPMNMQGNNQVRQNMATTDDQNDPLFMLKDM